MLLHVLDMWLSTLLKSLETTHHLSLHVALLHKRDECLVALITSTIMFHFDVAISNRSLGSTMSNIETYSSFLACINIISSYFQLEQWAFWLCVSHIEFNIININDFNWFLFFPFTTLKQTSSLLCIITSYSPRRCVNMYHKSIVSNLNCKLECSK